VFSKSGPEVRAMPENEMGVKPSNFWRALCHSLCKLYLSTKKPRNIRSAQLRFMKLSTLTS